MGTLSWSCLQDRSQSHFGPVWRGMLGAKMNILRGKGAQNQHFQLFALEPVSGALPGPSWSRLGAQVGAQIASQTIPKKALDNKTPKDPLKSSKRSPKAARDPPKPSPRRPQDGEKGRGKRNTFPTPLPDPLGTPFGGRFGSIWRADFGPFGVHFRDAVWPFGGPSWGRCRNVFGAVPDLIEERSQAFRFDVIVILCLRHAVPACAVLCRLVFPPVSCRLVPSPAE